MISNNMSDKILKEAFKQQKEIVDEENDEKTPGIAMFSAVDVPVDEDEEEDIDDHAGFLETRNQIEDFEV